MSEKKTPWNPSKKATARVKNLLPAPEVCPHCNQPNVEIKPHTFIYRGRSYGDWPWVYFCTTENCGAYVGMHPFTNVPLGTLANREEREARKRVKQLFYEYMTMYCDNRSEAYERLAIAMDISVHECHFGWFDVKACEKAEDRLKRMLEGEVFNKIESPFACLKKLLKKG